VRRVSRRAASLEQEVLKMEKKVTKAQASVDKLEFEKTSLEVR
jgi:hypothetical protein